MFILIVRRINPKQTILKLAMARTRNRITYALLILIVIGLGLSSRFYAQYLPLFIASYAGDTLWALQVFLAIGFLFPASPTKKVAILALAFAFFIELSQLYHPLGWIIFVNIVWQVSC
jgi:hypothetical protein